jgi:hypothetical protein
VCGAEAHVCKTAYSCIHVWSACTACVVSSTLQIGTGPSEAGLKHSDVY